MSKAPSAESQCLTEKLITWRSRPDDQDAEAALWTACRKRMCFLGSKLLGSAPKVRRWEDTDDLVQNASIRLLEALKVAPIESDRHLLNMAAKKIREQFIDKLRHYSGPRSPMRHHVTNSQRAADGERIDLIEQAAADDMTSARESEDWRRFHAAVDRLPEQEQEVFEMAWYLGADQKTIAKTLGYSVDQVKKLWKSAKANVSAATECP